MKYWWNYLSPWDSK